MLTKTSDNPQRSRFELRVDGDLVGYADYQLQADVMTLPHTEVQPRYRGRGLASTLIKNTLDAARARGLAVLPLCPFVSNYIADHPEYVSLVPADQRDRFGLSTA